MLFDLKSKLNTTCMCQTLLMSASRYCFV